MPKFEKQTLALRGHGPIKAQLDVYNGMLAMYTASARNAITRDAMWQGGEYYRVTFVPLKFTNYAKKYGYHVSSKYQARKQKMFGVAIPLVFTDAASHNGLRTKVLNGAKTEARSTQSQCYALIRMPGPAYMNATEAVYKTLRSVLPEELERVARIVGEALADNLEGTASKRGGAAPLRKLTDAQATTFARSVPAQRARKAPGSQVA